ncbi:hypothetical protein J1N35_032692 [Gossypium stocksii]|uniref:RNase H type-1 domain-containing protein n=1 Tax=Gossypium stocksii TaxID=47602 RepID=A0A9D3ZWH6_9ROSI|nr:hypothetical protein J1N35_032692 [Gossypium stocksii]
MVSICVVEWLRKATALGGAANESSLHYARDCSFAKGLWILLIPLEVRTSFFSMSLHEWLLWNLKNAGGLSVEGVSWPSLFSIVIWSLWKNRDDVIFNGSHSSIIEVVKRSFSWAKSIQHDSVKRNATLTFNHNTRCCPRKVGWIKINSDGSVHDSNQTSAIGGVLRDANGDWIIG